MNNPSESLGNNCILEDMQERPEEGGGLRDWSLNTMKYCRESYMPKAGT